MKSTKQSIFFHQRPITDLRFHPDGDLLFASSKDASASVMNLDGKLLGSFEKHRGSITTLAVNRNMLVTGCTDTTAILWDVLTGAPVAQLEVDAVTRGIDFLDDILFCTDRSMNRECFIGHYDPRAKEINKMYNPEVPTTSLFKSGDSVVFGDEAGSVHVLDLRTNKVKKEKNIHKEKITSLRPSACRTFFATASKDASSKIVDAVSLSVLKVFECDEPVNAACIFFRNDKIATVGGIEARDVTTTRGKGTFDTNFFDIVTREKIGFYSTHFGTINALDIHPQETHCATGGEDASVCLIRFGDDFNSAPTSFTQADA